MLGAIAGDVIGSVYEARPIKTTRFPLFHANSCFTDDTVLTVAVARSVLTGEDYASNLRAFGRRYLYAGYGPSFAQWLLATDPKPYGSWGNGSAMRVSAVGMGFESEEAVLREAAASAAVTHDHPEGVKGAQATALSVFLARRGASKEEIRGAVEARFGYDLGRRLDDIRPDYRFHVSCMESVPESIIAFLESACYEDAVRKAVSLGGDADTMGCIAGGIAEAYYGGVPKDIEDNVRRRLPQEFLELLDEMYAKFGNCETLREGGGDNGGEVAENAGVKKDGGCDKVGDVDDAGGVEKKGSAEDVGAN